VDIELARFVRRSPNMRILTAWWREGPKADDFLDAIGPHPSIVELCLGVFDVTDRSIPVLEQMPRLSLITFAGRLSPEGQTRLKRTRPELFR